MTNPKNPKQKSSYLYSSRLYQELPTKQIGGIIENPFPKQLENKIILGTAENMGSIPSNSVHLAVTSPPYNVGKEYDADLSLGEYLEFLKTVFLEVYRVLAVGGRLAVNIANIGRKPYLPLSDYLSGILMDIGFLMRAEIIWYKGKGIGNTCAWGSWMSASNPVTRCYHEYILVFSKGTFGRKKGTAQDTISKNDFILGTKSIWTIQPVQATRIGHPAPFPLEIPRRLIELYTFQGDVVLDPFMGSGQTAIAALKSKRKFVGFETVPAYVALAKKRIAKATSENQNGVR